MALCCFAKSKQSGYTEGMPVTIIPVIRGQNTRMKMIQASAVGRLGRNAELAMSKNGREILKFSIATDSGYGDNKTTTWVNCAMFGNRGAKLVDYLQKGTQVVAFGELSQREYVKKDGSNGASVEMVLSEIKLIGSKQDADYAQPPKPASPAPKDKDLGWGTPAPAKPADDDVPF